MKRPVVLTALVVALLAGCGGTATQEPTTAAVRAGSYTVVDRHPHDATAFTQGLLVQNGEFLEGTGLEGRSELRRVEIDTGRVRARRKLPPSYFGEGVTVHGDLIHQLTWRNGVALIWNRSGLSPAGRWEYDGEGWGLTTMGDELVMSDGTSTLRVLDPRIREELRRVEVTSDGVPVPELNELEYIGDGRVAANVWTTTTIVVIDMETGHVTHTLDVAELAAEQPPTANETNGIAVDPGSGDWYVTGKNWPTLYRIKVQLP